MHHSLDIKISVSMEKSQLTKKKKKNFQWKHIFTLKTKLVENFQLLLIASSCL